MCAILNTLLQHPPASSLNKRGASQQTACRLDNVAMRDTSHVAQECRVTMSRPDFQTRLPPTLHTNLNSSINTMAPSSMNQGNAPATLTLYPFHNDSRSRQIQPIRAPKIAQQPTPPIPHLYIRNARSPTLAPTVAGANQTSLARNARPTVVPSKPSPATTRTTPRAPKVAAMSNTSTALSPRIKGPTQTTRNPITTVTKVHAIAPVAGITSIDSVLRADSKQTTNKPSVPDHIRPKAEAIK
jgi:hypothetical protein